MTARPARPVRLPVVLPNGWRVTAVAPERVPLLVALVRAAERARAA